MSTTDTQLPESNFLDRPSFKVVALLERIGETQFLIPIFADSNSRSELPNVLYVQAPDRVGKIASFVEFDGGGRILPLREFDSLEFVGPDVLSVGDPVVFVFIDKNIVRIGNRTDLKPTLQKAMEGIRKEGNAFRYFEASRFIESDLDLERSVRAVSAELNRFSADLSQLWKKTLAIDVVRDSLSAKLVEAGAESKLVEILSEVSGKADGRTLKLTLPIELLASSYLDAVQNGISSARRAKLLTILGYEKLLTSIDAAPRENGSQSVPTIYIVSRRRSDRALMQQLVRLALPIRFINLDSDDRTEISRRIRESRNSYVFYVCTSVSELMELHDVHFSSLATGVERVSAPIFLLARRSGDKEIYAKLSDFLNSYRRGKPQPIVVLVGNHLIVDISTIRLTRSLKQQRLLRRAIEACVVQLENSRIGRKVLGPIDASVFDLRRGEVLLFGYAQYSKKSSPDATAKLLRESILNEDVPLDDCRNFALLSTGRNLNLEYSRAVASELRKSQQIGAGSFRELRSRGPVAMSFESWRTLPTVYVLATGKIELDVQRRQARFSHFVRDLVESRGWQVVSRNARAGKFNAISAIIATKGNFTPRVTVCAFLPLVVNDATTAKSGEKVRRDFQIMQMDLLADLDLIKSHRSRRVFIVSNVEGKGLAEISNSALQSNLVLREFGPVESIHYSRIPNA